MVVEAELREHACRPAPDSGLEPVDPVPTDSLLERENLFEAFAPISPRRATYVSGGRLRRVPTFPPLFETRAARDAESRFGGERGEQTFEMIRLHRRVRVKLDDDRRGSFEFLQAGVKGTHDHRGFRSARGSAGTEITRTQDA